MAVSTTRSTSSTAGRGKYCRKTVSGQAAEKRTLVRMPLPGRKQRSLFEQERYLMKKDKGWMLLLVLVTLLAGSAIVVKEACARAGGARSSGSSGSRSYASPGRSTMAPRAPDQGASLGRIRALSGAATTGSAS